MIRNTPARLCALLLCAALLAPVVGCGKSALDWTKGISTEVSVNLASAPALIRAFVGESGGMSPEEATVWENAFTRLGQAYKPVDGAIQSLTALDAQAALNLLVPAQDFILTLQAEGVLPLPKDERAARRIRETLFIVRALGDRLVARLQSKAAGLKQSYFEMRREMRDTARDTARLREVLRS